MANEFIARNGLIAQNNSVVTGSLTVTQGITGSFFGTSSFASTASIALNSVSRSIGAIFDNGNDVLTDAFVQIVAPVSMTISSWTAVANYSGSAQVIVQRQNYTTYGGDNGAWLAVSGITAPPTITSNVKNRSSTLTGWTPTITAGDVVRFYLSNTAGMTRLAIELKGTQT